MLTNAQALDRAIESFTNHKVKPIHNILAKVNPDYWPHPVDDAQPISGHRSVLPMDDPCLKKDRWESEWAWVSTMLHARNRALKPRDIETDFRRLDRLGFSIIRLLNQHWRTLAGSPDQIACVMKGRGDGKVHVSYMERLDDSPPDTQRDRF